MGGGGGVVQNKVFRFILNLGPITGIDNPTLDKVNMLCVDDRVRQLRLNHVHNIVHVHNRAPKYLYHNFVSVNEHHNYNTRSRAYNMTQAVAIGKNAGSFYIIALKDWNVLFSLLVFYVTCDNIPVIYVTAMICRQTEEKS